MPIYGWLNPCMSTVRKLSYRSELRELERICCDVGAYCREHGIDPDTALALTLCLDELFTNTLKYGYKSVAIANAQVDLPVDIHLERRPDGVIVIYRDRGDRFDPFSETQSLPDVDALAPEALPTSGFGIHLLRRLCSEARYAREGDTNTISLTFNWHSGS